MSDKPQDNHAEEAAQTMTVRVGSSVKNARLDKYLQGRFSNYSRVTIQKQIAAGDVLVNGKPVIKPGQKLRAGDVIELGLPALRPVGVEAEDIPLDIIHEDQDIIVLNKPAGILVHPARSHTHGTLVNALAFHCKKLAESPFDPEDPRPGIVHRLDRNTTGVMVAAKNPQAQWKISRQFEGRRVKKTYLAIVHGTPELHADRINAPLGVHPTIREKYAILGCSSTAKDAVTFYETLEDFRGYSLLKLTPKTGRTHQIRVHLSYIKHPIICDDMYGGKPVFLWQLAGDEPAVQDPLIDRCALHALDLEFEHPTTGRAVRFQAPLPEDMEKTLTALRRYRKE